MHRRIWLLLAVLLILLFAVSLPHLWQRAKMYDSYRSAVRKGLGRLGAAPQVRLVLQERKLSPFALQLDEARATKVIGALKAGESPDARDRGWKAWLRDHDIGRAIEIPLTTTHYLVISSNKGEMRVLMMLCLLLDDPTGQSDFVLKSRGSHDVSFSSIELGQLLLPYLIRLHFLGVAELYRKGEAVLTWAPLDVDSTIMSSRELSEFSEVELVERRLSLEDGTLGLAASMSRDEVAERIRRWFRENEGRIQWNSSTHRFYVDAP